MESKEPTIDSKPFVSCLCPTYLRPRLLANSLACYLAQDYPETMRELIILDDAGQFASQHGPGWEIISIHRRFRSLPDKFNALAGLAKGEILVVWEDDDIYLPWHVSAHVEALRGSCGFSKPSRVLSNYGGRLQEEMSAGRFHASIAFTKNAFTKVDGWPLTLRGDFDQKFMHRLSLPGPVADPIAAQPCSYIFRWEATQDYHGQGYMSTPSDEGWYGRAQQNGVCRSDLQLWPRIDENTRVCWAELGLPIEAISEYLHDP